MPIQLPWTILKFRSKSTGGNRTGNGLHMFRRRNEESVADDAVQTGPAMVRQVRRHRRNSQPTSSREVLETTGDISSKVVMAALEGEWICQQRKSSHDSFISYRVAVHAHIVSAVHSAICEADSSHHMFWDKLCLVSADEWEEDGFVRALSVASVAFLIVTPSILSDPNSTHLLSNSNDNVLLEWELAIDHHLNNQCTVVPIFVSSSPDTVFSKESLAIKDMNSYHTHSYYEKLGLKPKRTISETLDVVLSLRGICINLQEHGESSDDAKTATILNPTGVSAMLQLYRISSNRNDAQSRIPDARAHDSLKMLLGVESPFELWYSDVSAAKDENRIPKLNAENSLLGVVKRDLRIWIDSPNTDVIVIPTDRFIEVCEGSSSKIDSRATMPPAAHLMDVLTHLQVHNKFLGLLSLSSKPHTIKSSVLQFIYSLCHYNSAYSKFILDSAGEIPSFNVTSLMAKLIYEALERKLIANEPSIILVELLSDHETSKDHALKKNELQVLSWVIKLFEGRAKIVISGVNSLVPWNFLGEHFADRLAEYQWEDALEESAKIAARSVGGTLDLSAVPGSVTKPLGDADKEQGSSLSADFENYDPSLPAKFAKQDTFLIICGPSEDDQVIAHRLRLELNQGSSLAILVNENVAWTKFEAFLNATNLVIAVVSDQLVHKLYSMEMPDKFVKMIRLALDFAEQKEYAFIQAASSDRERRRKDIVKILPLLVGSPTRLFSSFGGMIRVKSVREPISQLFKIQGEHIHKENIPATAIRITQIRQFHLQLTAADMFDTLQSGLSATELQDLRNWLLPVDELEKAQRSSLMHQYEPGTRGWLNKRVIDWVQTSEKRVLWLQGKAGVGKSVMAALVTQTLADRRMLAATFFCKSNNQSLNSARNIVRTIAFHLCTWQPVFGRVLLKIKKELDADFFTSPVSMIFQRLVLQPLQGFSEFMRAQGMENKLTRAVIVLDALDECGTLNKRSELLNIFRFQCNALPSFVKFFVTSRPEPDIVAAFETLDQEMIIPSDAENLEDALIAAKNRLHSIQPSMDSENLDKFANMLVDKSGGLFIWLILALSNLAQSGVVSEISIDQIQVGMSDTYSETFKSMFRNATDPVLTALITAITMLLEPLSPVDLASLLGVDLRQIQYCLSVLQPVLGGHSTNEREPVSFLHKSVVDYLTGAGKSADATSETILSHYAVDPRFTVRKQVGDLLLGSRCLEILNSKLSAEPPLHEAGHFGQYASPLFQGSRVILSKSFSNRYFGNKYTARALEVGTASKFFTPDLVHACRFWASYVTLENESELLHLLQSFTEGNILHWIEAMIYLQQFDQISPIASSVSVLLMKHGASADKTGLQSIGHLFHDVAVMVQRFSIPLNFHPLQVYDTALTFSPRLSFICTMYQDKRFYGVMGDRIDDWGPTLLTSKLETTILCVAYSRDGKTVACGCADRTLNLFSTVTGKLVQSFRGSVGPILYVAFCPDGDTLITASSDKFVCTWSISGEKRLFAFKTGSFVLRSFAVCAQFDRYAIATDERVIKLFDLKSHKLLQTIAAQEQVSRCLAFSPDAKLLVSGSETVVKVFSTETGELVQSFNGHSGSMNGIVVLPDNDMIASCSDDKSIRLWSMSTSKCLHVFNDHEDAVNSISVSLNGMMLVSASDDKNIKIFSVPKRKLVKTFTGHNTAAKSVAISPDGFTLASGAADLKVWSVTEKPAQVFEDDHSAAVSLVEFNPANDICITGSADTTVRCWSMSSGRMILAFESHSEAITALAFSPHGDLVASGDRSGRTLVWTLSTGEIVFSAHGNQTAVTSIAFFSDGKKFACGHMQEPAFVHFLDSTPSKILPTVFKEVSKVCVSSDNNTFAFATSEPRVKVFQCSDDDLWKSFRNHTHTIWDAAFSPDGTKIASVSEDKTVRVFDWARKTLLHTFAKTATTAGHSASVKSVSFKDNVTLITRDEDGVSFAWSLKGAEKDWKALHVMDFANPRLHYAHLAEDGWIHCLGERLMWIPFELRGVMKARGNHIVLGSGFGVVTIIRVGRDPVPVQRQGHLNV